MYNRSAIAILSIALAAPAAASTTVCATDPASLLSAITGAEGSTSATFIHVARGTYDLNGQVLVFTTSASGQGALSIEGGYSADCTTQIKNPELTVLDAQEMSPVLSLQSTAGISVRYLTIQNGIQVGSYTAGLRVLSSAGGLIVDYNIVRNNASVTAVGVVSVGINVGTATGDIHFDGNLIANNSSSNSNLTAGIIDNQGSGSSYVTNNTVVDNVSTNAAATPIGGLAVYGDNATVSNNILWNNTGDDLYLNQNPVLVNNDYLTRVGSGGSGSGGDVNADPQFSSATDYHLLPTSPLLGQGALTPAGGLPTIDIEGNPRSYNGLVDMGAYERGDLIYVNDFDD